MPGIDSTSRSRDSGSGLWCVHRSSPMMARMSRPTTANETDTVPVAMCAYLRRQGVVGPRPGTAGKGWGMFRTAANSASKTLRNRYYQTQENRAPFIQLTLVDWRLTAV